MYCRQTREIENKFINAPIFHIYSTFNTHHSKIQLLKNRSLYRDQRLWSFWKDILTSYKPSKHELFRLCSIALAAAKDYEWKISCGKLFWNSSSVIADWIILAEHEITSLLVFHLDDSSAVLLYPTKLVKPMALIGFVVMNESSDFNDKNVKECHLWGMNPRIRTYSGS